MPRCITAPFSQPPRRRLLGAAAALLCLAAGPLAAQEAFPPKPIRFIVPYAAGGTTDLVARTVGARMAQTLGQPVIVENRAGAGGSIAAGMPAAAVQRLSKALEEARPNPA